MNDAEAPIADAVERMVRDGFLSLGRGAHVDHVAAEVAKALTAKNGEGAREPFVGSAQLMDAIYAAVGEHVTFVEPASEYVAAYIWCGCGWRSDDLGLVPDAAGRLAQSHLTNVLHAACVPAVDRILAARAAAPVEAGLAELRASILGLADEAKARQAAYPYHPHWAAWSLYEQDLRDLLRPAPAADGGAESCAPSPGCTCACHEYYADHIQVAHIAPCCDVRRPTPADQNAAESSGSDLEAEVGRDE